MPLVNIPNRNVSLLDTEEKKRIIWAIGGGKGGIGKTLLTSNMGVYLSWLNKKVVVIDMDLGGANLHTSLGVDAPVRTLSDIISGKIDNMEELAQKTPIKNLLLISGAQDPVGIANMRHVQKVRLTRKFKELNADYILLDLGAGTAANTVDFFLLADKKIVIVTPEPTSIENAYRFIKSAFYRTLRANVSSPYVRQLIEVATELKNVKGINTPKELIEEIKRLSPTDGNEIQNKIENFKLYLIVNQIRVKSEAEIGKSVSMVCERYFGIKVNYVGYLPYDNAIWQSIRKKVPFLIDAPNSAAVTHLEAILRNLLMEKIKHG